MTSSADSFLLFASLLSSQFSASLACMGKVAQDRQSELLERRAARNDLLKDGDSACDSRLFLSDRAESTEVEQSIDDVVLYLLLT